MVSIPFNSLEQTPISSHLSLYFLPMRDLSLFFLKNSFASKMRRAIRSSCNGNKSDADVSCIAAQSLSGSYMEEASNVKGSPKTLEEMLLQLDLEEAAARRAKLEGYGEINRRMSCVNNSDILRSARNALNQYPRFSLDGKDAMYRSSFRNFGEGCRKPMNGGKKGYEMDVERSLRMPPTVAGECVVWCKPGVVAKLMGLDAVPVPVPVPGRNRHRRRLNQNPDVIARSRNLRRLGRYEMEKDRVARNLSGCRERLRRENSA
ncbi:uncharacterized protein LOC109846805, partial [Asparagus officinalis]